ncbi:hypothetical protein G5O_0161 [Chlamydia psittaci 6BC]|nr:hypothetical protein G5O_0161 [Chlamydia psittaci 6BC]
MYSILQQVEHNQIAFTGFKQKEYLYSSFCCGNR